MEILCYQLGFIKLYKCHRVAARVLCIMVDSQSNRFLTKNENIAVVDQLYCIFSVECSMLSVNVCALMIVKLFAFSLM